VADGVLGGGGASKTNCEFQIGANVNDHIAALEAKIDKLAEDAARMQSYLRGLRDALGALATKLTGEELVILLLDRETRWDVDPENAIWVKREGFQPRPCLPLIAHRSLPEPMNAPFGTA
jgi:hypothetical protein